MNKLMINTAAVASDLAGFVALVAAIRGEWAVARYILSGLTVALLSWWCVRIFLLGPREIPAEDIDDKD